MAEKIRFHLDEHMPFALAHALRRRGIDVTTTADAGLRGKPDKAHLDYARREGRVLVTHDDDFLSLCAQAADYPGLVYCKVNTRTLGHIIEMLILLHQVATPEEMLGQVEFL